jgi:Ca2+-binding EF-hand superfamily protein
MSEPIKVILDTVIEQSIQEHELEEFISRIQQYVEHGFLVPTSDNEIFVDVELIQRLHQGAEAVRAAFKQYGQDEDGYVKYPWHFDNEQ